MLDQRNDFKYHSVRRNRGQKPVYIRGDMCVPPEDVVSVALIDHEGKIDSPIGDAPIGMGYARGWSVELE